MPFLYKYRALLESCGENADLIYWNRDGIEEKEPSNIRLIPFNRKATYNDGNKSKILSFVLFAKFVKKTVMQNEYDRILFLGTYGGTPVLLFPFLRKNKGKYWIDIRDYTYEKYAMYYTAEKIAIDNSAFSIVSSEGYKSFLPEHEYIITHNVDLEAINECMKIPYTQDSGIRISFIGNVRYIEENKKLLRALGNDRRFRLQYYGMGSEVIERYCKEAGIDNVDFCGRFDHEKTAELYAKTDIINNVYGSTGIELTTALSNKLYFAAGLHKPILVSPNTYMETISKQYGFGVTFDENDDHFADNLYRYYHSFSEENISGCIKFYEKVMNDEKVFSDKFKQFIIGGN